jgi:chitodextrinase
VKGPGTVYVVTGNGSSPLPDEKMGHHPVMFAETNVPGSVVMDVDGLRLDVHFIDDRGVLRDTFAIVKSGAGPIADPSPPTAPSSLSTAAIGARRVDLAWDPAADPESGITRYLVYRNGVVAGATTAGTTFADEDLAPRTTYRYEVSAVNGGLVEGPRSAALTVTTPDDPVQPLAVTVALSALSPADGREMNRPTVAATCTGGAGRYDWTFDWDGGDSVTEVRDATSPRSVRLATAHPGLAEGAHTVRVTCTAAGGLAQGEATLPISIGAREITAEIVPVSNVKWVGDELLALQGASHQIRFRISDGHYSGARYDYRIEWGDGTADFAPARTTATIVSATHKYAPRATPYPLVATVTDPARGKLHTIRAGVRVVPLSMYDQPAPSIRVSAA